ncbi:MAG TPA: hypothetical protein VJL27_01430 [Patescibacteria group bacterium]|nr:hypothetical protein [Patescibacteria group bacterium]
MDFFDFNNRDLVSIIFIILLLAWTFSKKEVRAPVLSLLGFALQPKIIVLALLMLAYSLLIVGVFYHFQLWDIPLLKETIYWIGVAFVMLLNFEKVSNNFKKQIIDSIKLVIFLEFIVGLYAFSVWGELVLIPLVFILSAFSVIAGMEKKTLPIKNFSDKVIGLIGLYLLTFALWNIFHDFHGFWIPHNLKAFLLPIVFTLCYLPFIYLVAAYSAYDSLFVFLDKIWFKGRPELAGFAKSKIFFICLFNLKKLKKIAGRSAFAFMDIKNKNDLSQKLLKLVD